MRMRLGILHDPEAQERMHEREKRAAEAKKREAETPIVRTEAEQKKYEEQKAKEAADIAAGKPKEDDSKPQKIKIKPLSDTRAIELGANFFSEAFIFAVAAGLIVWDSWRSRRKEAARRDDVAERLEELEATVESLRSQLDPDLETLHDLGERAREAKKRKQTWWSWVPGMSNRNAEDTAIMEEEHDVVVKKAAEEKLVPIRRHLEEVKAATEALKENPDVKKKAAEKKQVEEVKKMTEKKAAEEKKASEQPPARVDSVTATKKER